MLEREENQQELSSNREERRFEYHTSTWPKHFYTSNRQRALTFVQPLYDEMEETIGYRIINEREEWNNLYSLDELISYFDYNSCDVYTSKLYDSRRGRSFIWLDTALNRGKCTGYIANSSKQLVSIALQVGRRKLKIINATNWLSGIGYTIPLDINFLKAIRNVSDALEVGTYASPGGLGHAKLLDCMHNQGMGKILRPNGGLRERIKKFSSGGRADDFTLEGKYHNVWESDRDNAYAASALQGVPTGRVGTCFTIGLEDVFENTLQEVCQWQDTGTSFCQARIVISRDNRNKVSPFYTRGTDLLLEWTNKPGTYYGYFWYPMLSRCARVGYQVRIGKAWVWTELDRFLTHWIFLLINLRNRYKASGQSLEESIVKTIIVASIGRFGMSNDTLTLVTREQAQENDEQWLNLNASEGESLQTPYYIHCETDHNANHITTIASFIIMLNNIALTDYMMELEELGIEVLSTNYDSIVTRSQPPPKQGWKQKEFVTYAPQGKRTHDSVLPDGTQVSKHPGRKRE